jgi:hypothetical protein
MNVTYAVAGTAAVAVTDLANSGYLRIYGGSKAANADTATAEAILVQFALPADAFGTATNGVVTAAAITGVTASANGTATWARVVASTGTTVLWDGTAGESGSGADVILSSATISAGGAMSVVSWLVTFPRAAA